MATLLDTAKDLRHDWKSQWRDLAKQDFEIFIANGGLNVDFDMEEGPSGSLLRVVDTLWMEADEFDLCYRFFKKHFHEQWCDTRVPSVYTDVLENLWKKTSRRDKMAAGVRPRPWLWFLASI